MIEASAAIAQIERRRAKQRKRYHEDAEFRLRSNERSRAYWSKLSPEKKREYRQRHKARRKWRQAQLSIDLEQPGK